MESKDKEENKEQEKIFDDSIYKENLKNKLRQLLSSIAGDKELFISQSVLGPLNFSIEQSVLKETGVLNIKFIETVDEVDSKIKQVIFFVTPQVQLMSRIKDIITTNHKDKNYHLIFWPRKNILCKEQLERFMILGNLSIMDFNFDLLPIDNDLLTLDMGHLFKDLSLGSDLSIFSNIAESIMRLQYVYGKIPNIFAKGDGAKIVYDILKNEEKSTSNDLKLDEVNSEIETLILIDRKIDLVSPLMTQSTYAGLIDEIFGIKHGFLTIDPKILGKEGDRSIVLPLNSKLDNQYKNLKDLNINNFNQYTHPKLQECDVIFKSRQNMKDKSISETREFMVKFKAVQKEYSSLTNHINIAEKIGKEQKSGFYEKNYEIEVSIILGQSEQDALKHIEILIGLDEPINTVLRLLCLYTQVYGGIKKKNYDFLRREIIQQYGFHHILTLNNLEKIGLLIPYENKEGNWKKLSEKLKLINPDINYNGFDDPDDSAFAYGGYAPVCSRLVEYVFNSKSHWKKIEEQLKLLVGPNIFPDKLVKINNQENINQPLVIVYMIGGVTYAEIATLRYLGKKYNKEILICTTHIINGKTLINSQVEN